MHRSRYSDGELSQLVAWQVGRKPSIDFKVALLCKYGWPVVLKNSPLSFVGDPNPNLYYLVCPFLLRELSRLENVGLTRELQRTIIDDPALSAELAAAQENHDLEWRTAVGDRLAREPLTGMNIAGSSDATHLKCLHAHFAYYLTHPEYKVGSMIADSLSSIWCDDEMCRRWKP